MKTLQKMESGFMKSENKIIFRGNLDKVNLVKLSRLTIRSDYQAMSDYQAPTKNSLEI